MSALTHVLRPPGSGIYEVSAGRGSAFALQEKHYKASQGVRELRPEDVESLWKEEIETHLDRARVVLLGVPLDTGAGIRRGAAYGPRAVRNALLDLTEYRGALRSGMLLDLGDIFVNPYFLHDSMLNSRQIADARREMYAGLKPAARAGLPVSALSQVKWVLQEIRKRKRDARIFVIGGDHSIGWPVTEALHKMYGRKLGIAQPDAHTDLLESRLGVKYCFGTWSFHAAALMKKDKPRCKPGSSRFVQFGIRQTAKSRSHWEKIAGVRQFWAEEIRDQPFADTIRQAVDTLKKAGVEKLYFSNDIDGTDSSEALATGTPASGGPPSQFFFELIEELGKNFEIVGADIMEVAPDLASPEQSQRTTTLAARYAWACIHQQLRA